MAWLTNPGEPQLRAVVVGWAVLGLVLVWLLGRSILGRRQGVIAAAITSCLPLWNRAAVRVWPDVPGAVLALGAVSILVWTTYDDDVSWWMVAAVPVALGALVFRFGAPIELGVAAIALAVWRRRSIRSRPGPVVLTALLGGAVAYVILFTGVLTGGMSPFEAISTQTTTGGDLGDLSGPLHFGGIISNQLASPAGALLVVGLCVVVASKRADQSATLRFLGATALMTFLGIGLSVHAEDRYLAPVVPFVSLIAAAGLARIADVFERRAAVAVGLGGILTLVLGATFTTGYLSTGEERGTAPTKSVLVGHRFPSDCVIATGSMPQVAWYSGCRAVAFGDDPPLPPEAEYALWIQEGKNQPPGLETALAAWGTRVSEVDQLYRRSATLWQVAP
jgi:4-amino-4-deoxy-L-arabinose transferase-like glycosyltransferase